MKKTIKNSIKCKSCGQVIESKSITDYIACACGSVAVSGGPALNRKHCLHKDQYVDLSEYREFSVEELAMEMEKAALLAQSAANGIMEITDIAKRRIK